MSTAGCRGHCTSRPQERAEATVMSSESERRNGFPSCLDLKTEQLPRITQGVVRPILGQPAKTT